jgi:hypothetical protein
MVLLRLTESKIALEEGSTLYNTDRMHAAIASISIGVKLSRRKDTHCCSGR